MNGDNLEQPTVDADRSKLDARPEFGSYVMVSRAVQEATTKAIAAIAHRRVHEIIPEENTRRFMHGSGWSSPASPERARDEMTRIEEVYTVKWADIADHDLSIISTSIQEIGTGMADKQIKYLFQTVSNACDRSGNVVDGAERSIPDAFIEMFEKIEFGVDAKGEVSMPSIYVGPEMGDRILKELQDQPPEFQARAEALIEEKKAAALAREEARLKRFRTAEE
jgi:hypothetical protein